MNPERLLQHFERISEAPDAIPRLRRFILDLAVRGKLVEQDPNDEPAVELLKRIQAEKAELAKSARVQRSWQIRDNMPISFLNAGGWVWVSYSLVKDNIVKSESEFRSPRKKGRPCINLHWLRRFRRNRRDP